MNYNYSYEQTIYTSAYFNRIIDSELSKTPFYTKIIEDYKKVTKDPTAVRIKYGRRSSRHYWTM